MKSNRNSVKDRISKTEQKAAITFYPRPQVKIVKNPFEQIKSERTGNHSEFVEKNILNT